MNRQHKQTPEFKIESVEEFKARGGNVKRVDFTNAYDTFKRYGQNYKKYHGMTNQEIAEAKRVLLRKVDSDANSSN